MIHPNGSLFEELSKWVRNHELVFTTKEFMRQAALKIARSTIKIENL